MEAYNVSGVGVPLTREQMSGVPYIFPGITALLLFLGTFCCCVNAVAGVLVVVHVLVHLRVVVLQLPCADAPGRAGGSGARPASLAAACSAPSRSPSSWPVSSSPSSSLVPTPAEAVSMLATRCVDDGDESRLRVSRFAQRGLGVLRS